MIERFQELLSRPGVPELLNRIVSREERERERLKDRERAELRKERETVLDELALGRAALVCSVKDAERDILQARKALRVAVAKKCRAERELQGFQLPLERRIGRIESELARRPISFVVRLREKLGAAKRTLGASPARWWMEKQPSVDYWLRAERLGSVAREIEELEETDSARVESAEKHIDLEIAAALR